MKSQKKTVSTFFFKKNSKKNTKDMKGSRLFESLNSLNNELTEEIAVASISARSLCNISLEVLEKEDEDMEDVLKVSETIKRKGIEILSQKRSDLLSQIWKCYDDGSKGYLILDDMNALLHDYLQVLKREAPKTVFTHCSGGALLGIEIAKRKSSYVAKVDQEVLEDIHGMVERDFALLRRDIETHVSKMIERLLRPNTLKRVSKDVFDRCDEMTNDGWVTELEFKNRFFASVHEAIDWGTIFVNSKSMLGDKKKK